MLRLLAVLVGFATAIPTVLADDRAMFIGTWKLKSFVTEFQASGEKRAVLGNNPSGYVVFTPEGRVITLIAGEGRKPAQTNDGRAALLKTMFSYSGMYRVESDRIITKVDVSWNEAWTGTEQVRFFKIDGNRLDVISAWAPSAVIPEKPIVRGILTFEREK